MTDEEFDQILHKALIEVIVEEADEILKKYEEKEIEKVSSTEGR